jgi:hypothetical protein
MKVLIRRFPEVAGTATLLFYKNRGGNRHGSDNDKNEYFLCFFHR